MNKFVPHVIIVPEDEADEELANGFALHDQVRASRIGVARPAGGWSKVVDVYREAYVPYLSTYRFAHVVMLIDFDGQFAPRRAVVQQAVPLHLTGRTYVLGALETPERLKAALAAGGLEDIGRSLADGCPGRTDPRWQHPHLAHNAPELARLAQAVGAFVF